MQKPPLVSVIMPTYNNARFIEEAIQSVINQTYPHWELIVIDDVSTDDTQAIVKRFEDNRIRYLSLDTRQGHPSKVRNIGLKMAKGNYIGFLDSDDVFYPQALDLLCQALDRHPEWVIAQGYEMEMPESGARVKPNPALRMTREGEWQFTAVHRPESLKAFLRCQNPYMLGATLIRQQLLDHIGLLNPDMLSGEDQEYFLRVYLAYSAANHVNPIGVIPAPIYKYRQRQNSLVRDVEKKDQAILDNIHLLNWFFSESHSLPDEIRQLQGEIVGNRYSYAAQSLLLEGHPKHAKKWALLAWQCSNCSRKVWFQKLFPVLVGCALPLKFNHLWERLRSWGRNIVYKANIGHA